jgi:Hypervirulence associated proteins TUDOR domain
MMTVDGRGIAAHVLPSMEINTMSHPFKVGDHVSWNSEAGIVSGRIIKVHTRDTAYKGHTRRCSPEDPQYEIQSDKTDHIAMHKGAALHRIT